jgi:uncharacterized membrane protein YhiD involved in acid resistance
LLVGLFLSIILAAFYARFGETLSNRSKFAPILPILSLITLLVISIVKSSLALSLGLVGALSIVRFRTAIKDPEELIFLFFAIAIGLGLGADQRVPTLVAFGFIMVYLIGRKALNSTLKFRASDTLYLNIEMPLESTPEETMDIIHQILSEELKKVDLRRVDINHNRINLLYYFQSRTSDSIASLSSRLLAVNSAAAISIVEQNNLLGG